MADKISDYTANGTTNPLKDEDLFDSSNQNGAGNFNVSKKIKASEVLAYVQANILATQKFVFVAAFVADTTQTITHNLNTKSVIVSCLFGDLTTAQYEIEGLVENNNLNTIDLTFSSNIASVVVTIIG